MPAVTVHHLTRGTYSSTCGISLRSDKAKTHAHSAFDSRWGLVTCPYCLAEYAKTTAGQSGSNPEEPMTDAEPVPRPAPYFERFKHEWNMTKGPAHQHDCENCAYLGTKAYHPHQWDLYWCDQGGRPTVIARSGDLGEYTSGLGFVDRDVFLALAYVRAVKAGLFYTDTLPGLEES